jgi:hypothetical protein
LLFIGNVFNLTNIFIGTLVGLHFFSNVLKYDDAPVAVFACFMKALSLMVVALATESWVMYAGNVI